MTQTSIEGLASRGHIQPVAASVSMITKKIVVLANSTKHHPMRCVAGREWLGETGRSGGWIRPVSNHDEGALSHHERRLRDGREVRHGDVVEIPLLAGEGNPLQPENWLVQPTACWVETGTVAIGSLADWMETPQNLWLDPAQSKGDRAGAEFLRTVAPLQSLYLIRPEGLRFLIRSRVWDGYAKKQLRATFRYQGRHYDLALTDPLIGRKYFPDYPHTPEGHIELEKPGQTLLCVSLTPAFEGLHYKVVASVIELPS